MKLPDTSLELAVRMYRVIGQSEGKSPRTIEVYDRVLGALIDPESGLDPDIRIGDLTEAVLRVYIVMRSERELKWGGKSSPFTNNQEVRSLKAFFNWAFKEGYTDGQLLARFKPPRIPQTLVRILSDDELELVMEEAKRSRRNTAIVSMLVDCGVRASELCGIRLEGVDMERGTILVMGKGRKERMIAFGATTKEAILSYMHHERSADAACGRLFVGMYDRPMTVSGLWLIMRRIGEKTGIDRLHPHLFRHTFATRFLLAGGSSIMLKAALGHTSLKMVEHYTHQVTQQAVAAARQFSPLDAWRDR